MTSVKVKFRPSTIIGKEGVIYYQIIHKRVVRQLKTGYRIYAHEWDDGSCAVILVNNERYGDLQSIRD